MPEQAEPPNRWSRLRETAERFFVPRDRGSRRISAERRQEVIVELDGSAAISQDFLMLAILSCIIATFGLVLDSGAVIIGAMLIAPLMTPILALALALVRGDAPRMLRALLTLLVGIALSIGVSALLGTAVSTSEFNFLAELPGEVTARTSPTLFDLTIALAGGLAGGLAASYALAQPRLSPTLPGVAIATALMPPLCVVGIGISQGQPEVRDGALLLFLANFVAIVFSSAVVFALVGFGPLSLRRRREVMPRTFLLASAMLILIAIPLVNFMVGIAEDARENQLIRSTLSSELVALSPNASLVSFDKQEAGGEMNIQATVRTPREFLYAESLDIQRVLAIALDRTVALDLLVIPITRLEPLVPPTETPEPESDATPTPTSTAPATATMTAPPTSTPLPTATPTAPLTPSPTPSSTPTMSPAPAPTAPPTPTPVMYRAVGATGGEGVNVRRDPSPNAPQITALRDGVVVQLTGRTFEGENFVWVEIVTPAGLVGWIAEPFLVPYQEFAAP